ncbi:nodulation protein NodH [Aliigemmobacter aestuarii]
MTLFTSFVMFAEMRTGSNFLEANLNAMPGVTCHGEVFNPHFIGRKDQTEMFGMDMAARARDPAAMLDRMRAATEGLAGFRYFHDHDPRVCDMVLNDPACAKIILTRNPVESYVSWKIAQNTGQWKLTNAKNLKSARVPFDAAEFERHLADLQEFQIRLLHGLQVTGQTAFYIDYEDIQDVDVLNGLARFLGVEGALAAPDQTLKKQNPEEIGDKVLNPDEMEQALARLDRFNLARTPNFEPRRSAAIPSFVAAAGAPLIYMPLRGGPEAIVIDWLSRVGAGGVQRDFVQKTLRQWKRSHLPHRSFTVISHPVARAWRVWRHMQAGQGLADVRIAMEKTYRMNVPPPDAPTEAQQAGFLDFLRFCKMAVSNQTAVKLHAPIATQAAGLQGFAGFHGPDAVLREGRLAEGLAWLSAEVGVAPPALNADDPSLQGLAAIVDRAVEDAARDAYQRDYMAFGFGAASDVTG